MTDLNEATQEEMNLALVCGLMRRWGPSSAQIAELSCWRRAACRVLPRSQRWRVHPLAPTIRELERRLSISAAAGREQG